MRPVALFLLAAALAAGCMTSPPASRSPRIHSADGIMATLHLANGDTLAGEMLALDTAAFTLAAARGVVVVRHALVSRAAFPGYGSIHRDASGYLVDVDRWRRIQLESRYPHGIPAPALDAFLRVSGQARPDTLAVP